MKKSTKGAVAAGAAAVLLLGGAGSLAYWSADGDVAAGSINAGTLSLTPVNAGSWTLNGEAVTDQATLRVVPGDELLFTGTWTVSATGKNLRADVDFSGLQGSGDLATAAGVTVDENYTVNGVALTSDRLTSAHNGQTLAATVAVDFDFDAATNDSQGDVLTLSDGAITVTQVDATP
ncbi:alternate-type signal peptide domain-containing protein [Aeromicrobium sp.]|uniref:alternate-type signal peptide domain-containing protein n=1 Tax=Aeromicrobium sp. TaxID=1871063 RepID=UPI0028A699C4|nr:alternate-type signal peptide domain-containing protein [Aeromicrobium sp.]